MESIGKHIIIDGWFKVDSPLATVGGGHKFLTDFVAAIDMTIIVPPYIIEYPVDPCTFSRIMDSLKQESLTHSHLYQEMERLDIIRKGKLRGISGLVVLAESHIAYHTFPEYVQDENTHFVSMDIYSCKWFPTAACVEYAQTQGIVKGHCLEIDRFVDAPQKVQQFSFGV